MIASTVVDHVAALQENGAHVQTGKAVKRARSSVARKPLATLTNTVAAATADAAQPLKPVPALQRTPAKSHAPPQESPGLLRGFFAFLSPEQRRIAPIAGAASMHSALDAAADDHSAVVQPIPLSMNIELVPHEHNNGITDPNATDKDDNDNDNDLMPPLQQLNQHIAKSPMSTLLSAVEPGSEDAATAGATAASSFSSSSSSSLTAQPRNLSFSFASNNVAAAAAHAYQQQAVSPFMSAAAAVTPTASRPASRAGRKSLTADSSATSFAMNADQGACTPMASIPLLSHQSSYGVGSGSGSGSVSASANASPRFACAECGKHFPSNSALSMHLLVHSGAKPFMCPRESCSKSFRQKGHLVSHYRKHTGEKPFLCPGADCGKRFKDKSGLNTHVKRQHPGVSSANVTATTLSDESMDAALEDAIGRANVMLAELQADQEQQERARPARLSATPVPPPSAASIAAAGAAASASSKKRSHSSMETVSPLVQSASSSSTTPNLHAVMSSALDVSALGAASGAEEELEQLAASSTSPRQMDGAGASGPGAQLLQQHHHHHYHQQQQSSSLHFAALPESASVTPAAEGQGELVSRLLKRSRSESQSPASVLTSRLALQQVGALSPSMMMMERPASRAAGSFSPIPSPVLFSASTPLTSALYASRSSHLAPTAAAGGVLNHAHASGYPHPWLAHVPMPPTLQQLHSLSASASASSSASSYHHAHAMPHAWSAATSPSHAHLPPLPAPAMMHAAAGAAGSVAPLSALTPVLASATAAATTTAAPTSPTHSFNTSASSAFSFKNTTNAH